MIKGQTSIIEGELGLCNLKEKAQGDLFSMYLMGEGKDRAMLFSVVLHERTKGKGTD